MRPNSSRYGPILAVAAPLRRRHPRKGPNFRNSDEHASSSKLARKLTQRVTSPTHGERCSSGRGSSTPPTTPPLNGPSAPPRQPLEDRPAAACGETKGPRCHSWRRRLRTRRLRCRRRSPPLCGTLPPPASPRRCGRAPKPPQSPSRRRRGSRRVPARLRRLPRSTSLRLSLTRDAVRTAGRRTPNITSGAMLRVDSAGVDRVSGGTTQPR